MNDIEYHRNVPAYTRDIYLDLQRIEERGNRLKKARKNWLAAVILSLGAKRKSIGAAETA